jgi:hypothetical protein
MAWGLAAAGSETALNGFGKPVMTSAECRYGGAPALLLSCRRTEIEFLARGRNGTDKTLPEISRDVH